MTVQREIGTLQLPPPPADERVEQALLGAILFDNRVFEAVADIVTEESFSNGIHGRIYAAIAHRLGRGERATPPILNVAFEHDDALKALGGGQYLAHLAASAITTMNAPEYARHVADLALRRRVRDAALDVLADCSTVDLERPAMRVLEDAEQRLFDLAERGEEHGGPVPLAVAVTEALEQIDAAYKSGGKLAGLSTGIDDLDRILGGLSPGDLHLVASRPAMGKTAIVGGLALHLGREHIPSAFFELEMTRGQLSHRMLAALTGISSDRQRRGDLMPGEWERLFAAQQDLGLPIYIDHRPGATLAQIRQRARRIKRKHGLGIIIIDHLQLMRAGGKVENRRIEIGEITRGLKALAKELWVPVVLLSQLSRALEAREDKRPMLSDLRESGDIEQDADTVLFIYRDEYYLLRQEPVRRADETDEKFADRRCKWQDRCDAARGQADIIVSKNRHGPIGTVRTRFDAERTRFDGLNQGSLI
jgi:replicative DNA helicase